MPRIVREAGVSWEGNLARGTGAITAASSGAFVDLPFSIAARIAVAPDQTSPDWRPLTVVFPTCRGPART